MCTYVSIGGPGCGGDFLVRAEEKKKRPRHAATTCTRSNALAYPSVEERAAGPPVRAARTNRGIIMWNRDEGLPRPGSTIRRWSVSLCWSRFRAINIRKSSSCSERCADTERTFLGMIRRGESFLRSAIRSLVSLTINCMSKHIRGISFSFWHCNVILISYFKSIQSRRVQKKKFFLAKLSQT